ncbi:MAG: DUF3006 domain-containing protein [Clostridia bacterium]|nr:DUF3006 domain-containing protein [Clostridia bacterium]
MSLDLINALVNDVKKNRIFSGFIKELRNHLEKEDLKLIGPTYNENKITVKYRDKMLIERGNILNNYAQKSLSDGELYYIYSKNSKMSDGYNLCNCEREKSSDIIEVNSGELPYGATIGSVLRKQGDSYILDQEATNEIAKEINNMKEKLLKEQSEFLEGNRIEGHVYELYENNGDRAWLFDITSGNSEGIEEIDFPEDLLTNGKEGDLFIYKNGEYQKYVE